MITETTVEVHRYVPGRHLQVGDRLTTWRDYHVVGYGESDIVAKVVHQGTETLVTYDDGTTQRFGRLQGTSVIHWRNTETGEESRSRACVA